MFVDARSVESGTSFGAEACIVGAGAAGIALALELAAGGLDVTLVESGSHEPEPETQQLYAGRNRGVRYPLRTSRLRLFGGSTNHWGGLCRRLEATDFETRSWIEASGWPITLRELEPYYERASTLLGLPEELGDRPDAEQHAAARHSPLLRARGAGFAPILWRRSTRPRMAETYRDAIATSERITCVLNANVTELVPNADRRAIERVRGRTLGGRELAFRAHDFVLAAGGIENPRILLLSDARVPGGIGNQHDLVGRYFAEHLNRSVAELLVSAEPGRGRPAAGYLATADDAAVEVGLVPSAGLRRQHGWLGCSIVALGPAPAAADADDPAIRQLLGEASGSAAPLQRIVLGALAEQAPNPDSRVSLTTARDALGLRTVALDWRIAERDRVSLRETVERFAREAGRTGAARVRLRNLDEGTWVVLAGHHMGTTRMADDPKRGVTDRNGRVHGYANLFVAGSSLFPTSSYVNPTLTLVALAISQADFLKRRRRSGSGGRAAGPGA